jgi:hypothetical protein
MEIKKCIYIRKENKKIIKYGICYRFFWSKWSAKGFMIPFTLNLVK